MKKVLVIGGAGFIGSHVVDALVKKGLETAVIDNLSSGNKENLNKKSKFYEVDIKDEKISHIFDREKPDYVFHLAAQINVRKSIENPIEDADINILGSLNILNNCVKNKIKKIIFSSSGGAIYGDDVKIPTSENEKEKPISPYGIAKLTVENYLEFFKRVDGLDYVALRYANVYGPRQNSKGEAGVIAIFIDNLLNNGKIIINGSGGQTRDYIYVKDIAKANLLALKLNGIFNVGTGIETNINELYKKIKNIMKVNVKLEHGEAIKGEQMRSCLDYSKIKKKEWDFDYDLDKGLKETVAYFQNKK